MAQTKYTIRSIYKKVSKNSSSSRSKTYFGSRGPQSKVLRAFARTVFANNSSEGEPVRGNQPFPLANKQIV